MSNNFDFENTQVQKELTGGSFVKGESTLIAAGPPFMKDFSATDISAGTITDAPDFLGDTTGNGFNNGILGGAPIFPIGVIENANISQNKSLRRLAEIGSKRFHFVNGRTMASMSIARVLFNGPSLLRVLYAYMGSAAFDNKFGIEPLLANNSHATDANILSAPGYKDFFVNLDSSMFDMPFGLMFYMEDSQKKPYGAFYCTECYINTHQFNIGASTDVIAEGVTIQFDRLIPIDTGPTV
jgi:hypothetical protein